MGAGGDHRAGDGGAGSGDRTDAGGGVKARAIGLHVVLGLLAAVSLMPFVWLVCATLKGREGFFAHTFLPWGNPRRWTGGNYLALFRQHPFATWLFDSL